MIIKIKSQTKKNLLKLKLKRLSINRRSNLIAKIYRNIFFKPKYQKFRFIGPRCRMKVFLKKLNKHYPMLTDNISLKKLLSKFKNLNSRATSVNREVKLGYQINNKFLTKKLQKIIKIFPTINFFEKTKIRLKKRLVAMNRLFRKRKLRRNLSKRSFLFRITRKKRRRRLKVFRLNKNQPIFTKKTEKEKKFLLRARESLLKTKKYLYRKQFPKIKGRKNKNFNFFYYNNMDRLPFKFNIGRIVITYLLNNTFINIHNSKKMLKVLSAGKLGFKGPKRSTPYSRQVVARKAIKFISKSKLNVLDIFLNSNYNRWYYFIFKEISKPKVKPYVIRYLVISNPRSHGFIRDRKHRRK